jgi:hypothetical protein
MNTSNITAFLIPLGTGIGAMAAVFIFSRKTRRQREAAWINWIRHIEEKREAFLEQVRLLQAQARTNHEAQMARMRAEHEKMKTFQEVWLEELRRLSGLIPKPPGEE